MADQEIARRFVEMVFSGDNEEAQYLGELKAFCLDLRILVTCGFFIHQDTLSGSEFYNYVQRMNNKEPESNPWDRARKAANMISQIDGSACRAFEVVEALEEYIREAEKKGAGNG